MTDFKGKCAAAIQSWFDLDIHYYDVCHFMFSLRIFAVAVLTNERPQFNAAENRQEKWNIISKRVKDQVSAPSH